MAKLTNAQLISQLEELRAHCNRIETANDSLVAENAELTAKVEELRAYARSKNAALRELAQTPVSNKPQPSQFSDYARYCGEARAWCKRQGLKVVSYATRDQFEAAQPCNV